VFRARRSRSAQGRKEVNPDIVGDAPTVAGVFGDMTTQAQTQQLTALKDRRLIDAFYRLILA